MRAQSVVLACLLLLAAPAALARDRYDVEIVVFEHTDERALEEEHWRPLIVAPEFERAGLLENAGAADGALPAGFEPLPVREGRLLDSVKRLRGAQGYRVLRHLRWRQPALEPGRSVPVRVRAGEARPISTPLNMLQRPVPSLGNRRAQAGPDEDEAGDAGSEAGAGETAAANGDGTGETETEPARDAERGSTTGSAYFGPYDPPERTVAVYPLDGTIELVVSRYLHVHVDLYRTAAVDRPGATGEADDGADSGSSSRAADGAEAADGATGSRVRTRSPYPGIARGPDGEAMQSFPFRQSRRMRSGNLHYIDHPRMGLLVLVTPHEEEQAPEDAANADG